MPLAWALARETVSITPEWKNAVDSRERVAGKQARVGDGEGAPMDARAHRRLPFYVSRNCMSSSRHSPSSSAV